MDFLSRGSGGDKTENEADQGSAARAFKPEDTECGLGRCHPRSLQCCARIIFFTLSLALASFSSHVIGPFLVAQVPYIERQFELSSAQVGALTAANDIGFLVTILLISHFAKHTHRPHALGAAFLAFGVSCTIISALYLWKPRSSLADANPKNGTQTNKYICSLEDSSQLNNGTDSEKSDQSGFNLPIVLIFGLLLSVQGVSKATRTPLGTIYIDDNVPNRSETGFYLGIMFTFILFGPPVGFALGGLISRIPVDLKPTTMSLTDPRWISAWWLGFLIVGTFSTLVSLPLFFFPRHMPRHAKVDGETTDEKQEKISVIKLPSILPNGYPKNLDEEFEVPEKKGSPEVINHTNENGVPVQSKETLSTTSSSAKLDKLEKSISEDPTNFKDKVKDLPLSIWRILKRPVYVALILALSFKLFAVIGFGTFLIKYVERQFNLPAWLASSIFGLCNLVFGGLGTFVGGMMITRLHLTRKASMRWIVFAGFMTFALSAFTFLFGCDNEPMVGLDNSQFVFDDGVTKCQCDVSQYLPVCDGTTTYLSPCHAGCTSAANSTVYQNCSGAEGGNVRVGGCQSGFCSNMIPFIVLQVLSTFFSTVTITPVYVVVLRTVSEADKSLAMGFMSFCMSLLGFIPGPIVFGAAIDTTCLIWSTHANGKGACALYDNASLRSRYIGLDVGVKAFSWVFYIVALFLLLWEIRTGRTTDEKPERAGKKMEKTIGKGGDSCSDQKAADDLRILESTNL